MNDIPAALPSIIKNNISSLVGRLLFGAAAWLVGKGILTDDQTAEFITIGSGAVMGAISLAWAWYENRRNAKKLVAAAATRDPTAKPEAPEVKAAITAAILDPNSAITAKEAA